MDQFLLSFILFFSFLAPNLNAQQNYSGNSVLDCDLSDDTGPSSAFLYTCNGANHSCQSFLIFKSQPPFNSASTISNLTSSDPSELALINNISSSTLFPPNKEVIVPVICSCSGQYYQANTSYIIPSIHDTYYTIAKYTYQGLTSCNSLKKANIYGALNLVPGLVLHVPLRCACPTSNQNLEGTKFLLTYLVNQGDAVPKISKRFNVSVKSVVYANGFDEDDPKIYPFTTILIPLSTKPSSSQTIIHYPPPPNSSPIAPNRGKKWSSKKIYVWFGVGSSLLVLGFVSFILVLHQKKKREKDGQKIQLGKKKGIITKDILDDIANFEQGLKVYKFEELEAATENFSAKNQLDGSVYGGILNGEPVAIKKMCKDVSKEVNLLQTINHFNLISLRGACEHDGVFYLVQDCMENGSLHKWLQESNCLEIHSWNNRIKIALDIANGLHYLHNFTYPAYVHKYISSRNILLDQNLRAKIANFSLARSAILEGYSNSSRRSSLGSKGYMAPEYIEFGMVAPEMDVYAFGVVLLELITGKQAVFVKEGREVLLSEVITSLIKGKNTEAELGCIVDPRLPAQNNIELALRMLKISLGCLVEEPESRMSIGEVVSILSRIQVDAQISEPWSMDQFEL